jgi:hypothetical protein
MNKFLFISRNRKNSGIALIILALFVFSAIITGFHTHIDGDSHDDCPLCVAASMSGLVGQGVDMHSLVKDVILRLQFDKVHYTLPFLKAPYSGRAPPVTSHL